MTSEKRSEACAWIADAIEHVRRLVGPVAPPLPASPAGSDGAQGARLEGTYMERIEWEKGDRLSIRSFGELTKGTLRYPNMIVTAAEGGCSGGWDVYDATTEQGKSVSFYGFSVESLS